MKHGKAKYSNMRLCLYVNSFNPSNNKILFILSVRELNSRELSNLLKVMQHIGGGLRLWTQVFWLETALNHYAFPPWRH